MLSLSVPFFITPGISLGLRWFCSRLDVLNGVFLAQNGEYSSPECVKTPVNP